MHLNSIPLFAPGMCVLSHLAIEDLGAFLSLTCPGTLLSPWQKRIGMADNIIYLTLSSNNVS